MKLVDHSRLCRIPQPITSRLQSLHRTPLRGAMCTAEKGKKTLPGHEAATDRIDKRMLSERQAAKQELFSLCQGTQMGYTSSAQQDAQIAKMVGTLEQYNPTSKPAERQDLLCRSWRLLYSNLPQLEQKFLLRKQKSSRLTQSLDVLSFFTLGYEQAELKSISQVIRPNGTYSMVQSIGRDSVQGQLLARGRFEVRDPLKHPERFHVTFSQIGLHFDGGPEDVARFRRDMEISGDGPNERCINLTNCPSSYSDCTYLDKDVRVARAMLGALYVLVPEPDTYGDLVELSAKADMQKKGQLSKAALSRLPKLFAKKS